MKNNIFTFLFMSSFYWHYITQHTPVVKGVIICKIYGGSLCKIILKK
jgi:hypothetical protein